MSYCMWCMQPIMETDEECPFCGKPVAVDCQPHHLIPGTLLNNKFLVGKVIGQGGFGITYIGRDTKLDIKVAIKEYYPNGYVGRSNTMSLDVNCNTSENDREFYEKGRDRFLKEARTLAKFSDASGIVSVRDFFEENNTVYIVMEYLDGEDLKEYLRDKGTISAEKTIQMMMPVMESLEKIHTQGLIHRDISPDNIRICGNGVKLLDFGAARTVSALSQKSLSVMLKPGYAPYEQYFSTGEQGYWTDVYALCATMYKCMTGVTPEEAPARMACDNLKTPSALGVNISTTVERAIMKGLSVQVKDRYQSMKELIRGLNGLDDTGYEGVTICNPSVGQLPKSEEVPAAVEKQEKKEEKEAAPVKVVKESVKESAKEKVKAGKPEKTKERRVFFKKKEKPAPEPMPEDMQGKVKWIAKKALRLLKKLLLIAVGLFVAFIVLILILGSM